MNSNLSWIAWGGTRSGNVFVLIVQVGKHEGGHGGDFYIRTFRRGFMNIIIIHGAGYYRGVRYCGPWPHDEVKHCWGPHRVNRKNDECVSVVLSCLLMKYWSGA